MDFASAIVFSPEVFASEEPEDIDKLLEGNNYTVTVFSERRPRSSNQQTTGSHFPYHVMHTCAHGNELDGYFVVQDFTGRKVSQAGVL
jgi:hypothetical protein